MAVSYNVELVGRDVNKAKGEPMHQGISKHLQIAPYVIFLASMCPAMIQFLCFHIMGSVLPSIMEAFFKHCNSRDFFLV